MIIFNDSISKFYQCSIWGLCRGISMFFSICLTKKKKKKMPRIKFLGILKNMSPRIKYIFCLKKKSNVGNILNIFKLDFITQIIYCIITSCLNSLFILFLFSYIGFKETNIDKMLNLPYSYNWQKFNNKISRKKRKQEYQSMDNLNM